MKNILIGSLLLAASLEARAQLIITAVYDGPLSGGVPKGIELFVMDDINDLSAYGVGSANNGKGSDGIEFTFPAIAAAKGSYIYLASESAQFESFFGFAPDYVSNAMSINGDDAIELFFENALIDLFGNADVDGTGQTWEYKDGWARRQNDARPSIDFEPAQWQFSGVDALDGASSNDTAMIPVPVGDYSAGLPDDNGDLNLTLISSIQGTPETQQSNNFGDTDVSPLAGQTVKVEAIVIGDFQDIDDDETRNLKGIYLQEERLDEDGDANSSEGIFVYTDGYPLDVQLGDKVSVTGVVGQYFGETRLFTISDMQILAQNQLDSVRSADIILSDNTGVTMDKGGKYQADLEAFEGMLVHFPETLTVTEQFNLDRFNEIKLVAGPRPFQFTQGNKPDQAGYLQHQTRLAARRITYDDGRNEQNVDIRQLDGFGQYSESVAPRMGDQITGLTGVLDYKWSGKESSQATWRVRSHRDGSNDFTHTAADNAPNPRPLTPPFVAGNLKIASYNVLNFFKTLDQRTNLTAAGHRPRGADDVTFFYNIEPATAEYDRQLNKLVKTITAMDADILGLVELENEFDPVPDGSTAIEALVIALNRRLGDDTYRAVYPGQRFVGTDAIAVGMIYKPAVVQISANSTVALLDDNTLANVPAFRDWDFATRPIFNGMATNRVPMAVSFRHTDSGENLVVVVNHFKSKGSSRLTDPANENFDKGDGAAFFNARRLHGARAVHRWLDTAPTGIMTENTVILGDLNAYAQEDPVQYLLDQGFQSVKPFSDYSYIFDGQLGTLDYLLVSPSLFDRLSGAAHWHINADEADAIDYNLDFGRPPSYYLDTTATRNSDHDPVWAGFALQPVASTPHTLLVQLDEALEAGRIAAAGKHLLEKKFNLLRFKSSLKFADIFHRTLGQQAGCTPLKKAEKRSDGLFIPKDLITGPGVNALNRAINQVITDKGCQ